MSDKPVAYRYWNEHNKCFFFCDSPEPVDGSIYEPLYTTPQPKQEHGEPDDEVLGFNGWGFPIEPPPKPTPANKEQIREALVFNLPLYTTPQQRKPLTDEQIDDLARTMVKGNKSVNWLARAIEAAHGIKE